MIDIDIDSIAERDANEALSAEEAETCRFAGGLIAEMGEVLRAATTVADVRAFLAKMDDADRQFASVQRLG